MLRQVDIVSDLGGLLPLQIGTTNNGIILRGIEGLDPSKATISQSDYAHQDGGEFHSARRESKNIRIAVSLDSRFGGGTVANLRRVLYGVAMPKTQVTLRLETEGAEDVYIRGVVESIDTPIFTDKPAAIISIICPQPIFYETAVQSVFGAANNGIVTKYTINYAGTVETGFRLGMNMPASGNSSQGFVVHHWAPNGDYSTMEFASILHPNDEVVMITSVGNKSVMVTRGLSEFSILAGISPQSKWIQLYPGENELAVVATGASFTYELSYTNKYGGL